MANSTRKSLAGSAAAVAKRVVGRRPSDATAPAEAAPAAKKAPAKKAPAKKVMAVKDGEGTWTKSELNEVRKDLRGQRENLSHLIVEAEHDLEGLMRDAGNGAGHDQADLGATSFERDHELDMVNRERDMIAQIDRALARIIDGSYGICESCEQPIGKMRLMAFPRATLCMSCKQREERR